MIRALHGPVQGKVFLYYPGSQDISGHSHGNAVLMVGKTDDQVRKKPAISGDNPKVHVAGVHGIAGRALQQAELGIDGHDRVIGPLDILHGAPPGADDQGLPHLGRIF